MPTWIMSEKVVGKSVTFQVYNIHIKEMVVCFCLHLTKVADVMNLIRLQKTKLEAPFFVEAGKSLQTY